MHLIVSQCPAIYSRKKEQSRIEVSLTPATPGRGGGEGNKKEKIKDARTASPGLGTAVAQTCLTTFEACQDLVPPQGWAKYSCPNPPALAAYTRFPRT